LAGRRGHDIWFNRSNWSDAIVTDEAELIALEHARRRAIEACDFDRLAEIVGEPFHYAHITGLIEDRAGYFDRTRGNPGFIKATSAHDIEVTMRPGYALMHGRSYIAIDPALPDPITQTWFLSAWERQGGAWKIVAYASSPLPADQV